MLRSFAGGAVFGERFGEGPAQILGLHGWGRDRGDFREALAGLDAVVVDLPGFGASPPPPEAVGAGGYADLLVPLLDELDESVVLAGHSFGGRIAVHLARRRPDRVAGLVLIGVPLLRGAERRRSPLGYRIVRRLHRLGWLDDARLEVARQRFGSPDYRAAHGLMREVLVKAVNESYETELTTLGQPVHLVWGADDRDVPVEVAERATELLSRSTLTVLAGVGHHVLLEAPEAVRAAVLGVRQ